MRFAYDPASGEVWDALLTATRQRVQCRECCSGCVWVSAPSGHHPHFLHIPANPECSLSVCADELQEGGDVDAQRRGGQTPWHKAWSVSVRPECREVKLHGRPRDAALVADDCIVEFQHSALSSEEFARRCAAPVRQAVWIFDVTDRVVNKCKGPPFIILPTSLACDYAAEAKCTLLWQVKDGSLYESISEPYGIRQNQTNCIARDVRPWAKTLPDVFTDSVLSAEGRAWNASRTPPEWISVLQLAEVARMARAEAARMTRVAEAARISEELRVAEATRIAEELRVAEAARISEELRERRARLAAARELARAQREAQCESQAAIKRKRLAREEKVESAALEDDQRLEKAAKLIEAAQVQGNLSDAVVEYLAGEEALRLRLQCSQNDAEHLGAKYLGTRGLDVQWYAPSLSWLWLHWHKKPLVRERGRLIRGRPLVRPEAPTAILSAEHLQIEELCQRDPST